LTSLSLEESSFFFLLLRGLFSFAAFVFFFAASFAVGVALLLGECNGGAGGVLGANALILALFTCPMESFSGSKYEVFFNISLCFA